MACNLPGTSSSDDDHDGSSLRQKPVSSDCPDREKQFEDENIVMEISDSSTGNASYNLSNQIGSPFSSQKH